MKKLLMPALVLALSGCYAQLDDLRLYVDEVKQRTPINIEAYPEFETQPAYVYESASLRSPFTRPKTQSVEVVQRAQANCLQPDFNRPKHVLEAYGLDALSLSGSFTSQGKRWILIKANDGSLHQATIGDHMGLFFGKITAIEGDKVFITEMLPDGAGCWQTKQAELSMAAKAGENNNV